MLSVRGGGVFERFVVWRVERCRVDFTSLSDDVVYYVSTFIDYTFRTFAGIFIVWPSLYVWPLSTYDV